MHRLIWAFVVRLFPKLLHIFAWRDSYVAERRVSSCIFVLRVVALCLQGRVWVFFFFFFFFFFFRLEFWILLLFGVLGGKVAIFGVIGHLQVFLFVFFFSFFFWRGQGWGSLSKLTICFWVCQNVRYFFIIRVRVRTFC